MNSNPSLTTILLSICLPFLLSSLIVYVYKKTQPTGSYTYYFSYILMLLPPLISIITLVIENNIARGLGLVGTLSIIRFRNALKSPLDTIFIFWALAVGLACGTGHFDIAVIIVVCCFLFIYIVKWVNPHKPEDLGSILKIVIKNSQTTDSQSMLEKTIGQFATKTILVNSFFNSKNEFSTYIFNVHIADLQKKNSLVNTLANLEGVDSIEHSNEISSPFVF